jgi:nitronate monooxygenase
MTNPLALPNLRLPAFVAPMFLISGVDLVHAACANGLPASFPAANARTSDVFRHWLTELSARHDPNTAAPWGVNLNTHRLNPRLESDLELICEYRAPFVVTALGAPAAVVDAVHSYGGLILADVASIYHARKAADLGVDALILVMAGAGGHTGHLSPIAFINEVRQFWRGPIITAGAITTGADIVSMLAAGADYAYMGTRFIACSESLAKDSYREMLIRSDADDIICTKAFTGIANNMLRPSIVNAGIDPDNIPPHERSTLNFDDPHANAKAWRDIWSAGQGVGSITKALPLEELVTYLSREYDQALNATITKLEHYQGIPKEQTIHRKA